VTRSSVHKNFSIPPYCILKVYQLQLSKSILSGLFCCSPRADLKGEQLMKKAICVLLALLLATGSLAGCGKDNANETTTTTTAAETTAEETTTTAEETTTAAPVLKDEEILALSASEFFDYLYNMNKEGLSEEEATQKINGLKARQFLNYIKAKKVADIAAFTNGVLSIDVPVNEYVTNEAYKIFNKIDVDSYEIVPAPYSPSEFLVILRISKSDSPLFPLGTSRWRLSTEDNFVTITAFRNINDTCVGISQSYASPFFDAVDFCYQVSARLGCFETMDDFNKLALTTQARNDFGWFTEYFVSLLLQNRDGYYSESAYPVKRTEVETLAKKTFGVTNIDFTKYSEYNSADDTINSTGHGVVSYPVSLFSSTYDQATRIRTVVLDFYSDHAYLLKAKTMKYTLRENTDGSLTLLSTRLVYDSGYGVYSYSVS